MSIHVSGNQLLMCLTRSEMGSTRLFQGQVYAVCAGAGALTFTVLGRGDETAHAIMRGWLAGRQAGRRARPANKGVGAWPSPPPQNTCGSWRTMQIGGVANLALSRSLWRHVWLERRAGQKEQVRYFSHTAAGEKRQRRRRRRRRRPPPLAPAFLQGAMLGSIFHSGSYCRFRQKRHFAIIFAWCLELDPLFSLDFAS